MVNRRAFDVPIIMSTLTNQTYVVGHVQQDISGIKRRTMKIEKGIIKSLEDKNKNYTPLRIKVLDETTGQERWYSAFNNEKNPVASILDKDNAARTNAPAEVSIESGPWEIEYDEKPWDNGTSSGINYTVKRAVLSTTASPPVTLISGPVRPEGEQASKPSEMPTLPKDQQIARAVAYKAAVDLYLGMPSETRGEHRSMRQTLDSLSLLTDEGEKILLDLYQRKEAPKPQPPEDEFELEFEA